MTPPSPRTLNDLFFDGLARHGQRPVVMRHKREGKWLEISYATLRARVQAVSAALREAGIAAGDRVAILSENRPEWAIADYACLATRAISVPLYPTLPAGQLAYILRDSGARLAFASTAAQAAKLREIRAEVPALERVIVFDADAAHDDATPFGRFEAEGHAAAGVYPGWESEARLATAMDLATLIYTSGTTGEPKGVMLTHGNIASNVVDSLRVLQIGETDECLSFLPLSHIFERMVGHYLMFWTGTIINYATNIGTVPQELLERRPTVVASVPRLYEKIHARIVDTAQRGGAARYAIFRWARRVGEEWAELHVEHKPIPASLAWRKRVADALVLGKVRDRMGGRIRFFVSGGAPLSRDLARFFYASGLPILQGYGLTETSPVISVNTFAHHRLGSVGHPIPNVEVRIAPDGEILSRGPNVMAGYFNKPEATAEVLDADGWFHTGDIGRLDADGFLFITDRKKDLIVTAGGKNIAPQPIEGMAKGSKFVSNCCMLGDRRKYPILLVVPDFDQLRAWADAKGLRYADVDDLLRLPEVHQKMDREVKRQFRDLAQYEIPKRLLLLREDFSIERGEVTPKLSVRRRVVEERYHDQIEALYAE